MVKTLVVEFDVRKGSEKGFEKELLSTLKRLGRDPPDGLLGVLELKGEESSRYMHLVFWKNKSKWKAFIDSGRSAKLSQFVASEPKRAWCDTIARLQEGRLRLR